MTYDAVGLLLVLAASMLLLRSLRDPYYPRPLLHLAFFTMALGATLRYEVMKWVYEGRGDAVRYFQAGALRAQEIRSFETLPLSPEYWQLRGSRWGTAFIEQVSGLVLALIGETLRGEFLVFALFGLAGSYLIVQAARMANPRERVLAFATWVWLWPSVWFWPASVGKESLVLLSFGLSTRGYVGDGRHLQWPFLLAGVGLAFMVRPHVAAVMVMALAMATVIVPAHQQTWQRVTQIIAMVVLSAVVLSSAQARLGIAEEGFEGLAGYVDGMAAVTQQGGSRIAAPSGATAPLQAIVNVWARPFLWEADSVMSALAALEALALWVLVWRQRRQLWAALRNWRSNRLLRFGLPLVLGYTLMIGLSFANLGILARQRAPMFPFLLLLLAGAAERAVAAGAPGAVRRRYPRISAADRQATTGPST